MPFLFIKICGGDPLVSLVWNTFDVSSVFGAGSLSFWQCTGVGAIISFL